MHAFGAYFGMAITVVMSRKNYDKAGSEKNDTTVTSDIFSLLGAKNAKDLILFYIVCSAIISTTFICRVPSSLAVLAKLQRAAG